MRPIEILEKVRAVPLPGSVGPNQISDDEARLLVWIGEQVFTGAGVCIDAGCGSGGSSRAMCDGLARNVTVAGRKNLLHCFDRFIFDHESYRSFLVPELGTPDIGRSFIHHFFENIGPHLDLVLAHAGDLHGQVWDDTPVEILFIDVAKMLSLHQKVISLFFSRLIPGKSRIIHQDFERPNLHWIHTSIGFLLDECPVAYEIVGNSLVLRVEDIIPQAKIDRLVADDFTLDERLGFLDRVLDAVPQNRSDVPFVLEENYRLTRAYLHAHHGDLRGAADVAAEVAQRPYFQRRQLYQWMLKAMTRANAKVTRDPAM